MKTHHVMHALWKKAVVLLVVVIAILQVIHMMLLSRLEARKNRHNKEGVSHGLQSVRHVYHETEVKEDRARMLESIHRSSVLDSSGEFHIINFLIAADSVKDQVHVAQDLSVITQTTINGLHNMEMLVRWWRGPISVSVFSLSEDIPLAIEMILRLRQCYPPVRYNVSFHLVYPLDGPTNNAVFTLEPSMDSCELLAENLRKLNLGKNYALGVAYPINLLRNVARRSALTEFIFMIDIDMLPSENLHKDFINFAREKKLFGDSDKEDKTLYVVPAFEMKRDSDMPQNKASLIQLIDKMEIRPFYFELCLKCQKYTDYEVWQREGQSNKLQVLFEVLWRDPWEPFYIGRNIAPLYDERFRQYGFNRISQVCELHVAGYKFSVLNNPFVVHRGHKTPSSFHKDKELDQERNRALFRQFKTELKERYPRSSRRCY